MVPPVPPLATIASNIAGVLVTGSSWEQDGPTRKAMLDVNALGTMNGTVAALERMIPAGHGHVVNVISLAGLVAAPGEVNYSASKHAAMAFTLGTLFDLRRSGISGVQLSATCPDGICCASSISFPASPCGCCRWRCATRGGGSGVTSA